MPNFNHAAYLRRALEAVLSQSRLPDEFLILDDGSTDESVRIIESYLGYHPFMKLIRHDRNQGFQRTLEELLQKAKGDFVYGASADDRILPGFFEEAMRMATQYPQTGIVLGQMIAEDPAGNRIYEYGVRAWRENTFIPPDRFLSEYLERESPMHSLGAATIYRRHALSEIGGMRFQDLGHWCDSFAGRTLGLKYGACYLARPCMIWTAHPEGIALKSAGQRSLMMDHISKAASLMRSGDFRSLYPESHVRRWEKKYSQFITFYSPPVTAFFSRLAAALSHAGPFRFLVPAGLKITRQFFQMQ